MELQVDKPSSKVMVDTPAIPTDPSLLDHLVLEEDKVQSDIEPSEEEPQSEGEEEESDVDAMFMEEPLPEKEPVKKDVETKHQIRFRLAWEIIKSLTNTEVLSGTGNDEIRWRVIESCELDETGDRKTKNANIKKHFKVIGDLADSIINFWSGDIWEQWDDMNNKIEERINKPRRVVQHKPMKLVSKSELLTFIGLFIGAANQAAQGRNLWTPDKQETLSTRKDYSKHMSRTRFHDIKSVVHFMMEKDSVMSTDDWWKARKSIEGFNERRVEMLNTGIIYVLDESMSAMVPRYVPICMGMFEIKDNFIYIADH